MPKKNHEHFRIGIVCGKLGDVDGVSLEVEKWIKVLLEYGHEVFTFAGTYVTPLKAVPRERQIVISAIRFNSEEQLMYEKLFFPYLQRHPQYLREDDKLATIEDLENRGRAVANQLFTYIQDYAIDVIIGQNTNAMPMTLIGGMAVYLLAVEKRVATIFHHHDFWWERSRFSRNRIEQLLGKIMPPVEPGLEHVVLSSYAEHILRSIKRVHPKIIPNCEDFDLPTVFDDYNRDFRQELGFSNSDILIVQPTRIVRRKRIEDSIALVGKYLQKYPQFRERVRFIISLYQGDEHDTLYVDEIKSLAEQHDISLHLISDRVSAERGNDDMGQKLYSNRDVLVNADLVTYLPIWEGFGNALLEAIAAKVPVVTTEYLVYKTDIKVVGFHNIEIRDVYGEDGKLFIPERAVDEMHYLFTHPKARETLVHRNFRIGKKEFGLRTLRRKLRDILVDYGDEIKAGRKRISKSKIAYPV